MENPAMVQVKPSDPHGRNGRGAMKYWVRAKSRKGSEGREEREVFQKKPL